jgi:hypothetical protein
LRYARVRSIPEVQFVGKEHNRPAALAEIVSRVTSCREQEDRPAQKTQKIQAPVCLVEDHSIIPNMLRLSSEIYQKSISDKPNNDPRPSRRTFPRNEISREEEESRSKSGKRGIFIANPSVVCYYIHGLG